MKRERNSWRGCLVALQSSYGCKLIGVWVTVILLGAVGVCFNSGEARAQKANAAAKQRFLSEASAKWEEYTSFLRRLQGTISSKREIRFPDGRTQVKKISITIKQAEDRYLLVYEYGDEWTSNPQGPREMGAAASGTNPRYTFQLRRKGEQPWLLVHTDLPGGNTQLRGETPKQLVEDQVFVPVSLPLITLDELVKRPTFRVTGTAERAGGLIEIQFENPHPIPKNEPDPVLGGSVLLDPDHSWCVRECTINGQDGLGGFIIHQTVEYRTPMGAFPIPQRVTSDVGPAPGGVRRAVVHEVAEINLMEAAVPPPVEEFTLSAFGFPEPVGVTWEKPIPTYVWILAIAAACGGLALLFRYLARRQVPQTAGTESHQ